MHGRISHYQVREEDDMFNYEFLKPHYTAYWNRENHDRPLIWVLAPAANPLPDIPAPEAMKDKWEDIEYLVASTRRQIENTYYGGEAIPVFNPNLGPDILGAIAGCELEYGQDTSWAVHCVHNWDDYPELVFNTNNRYWKKIEAITKAAVEDAQGDYLVGITDLHPGTDGLASLRGPQELCLDMLDNGKQIKARVDQLFEIYKEVYMRLEAIISPHQEGSTNWMGIWHPSKRWYVTGCDFSCMINSDAYEEFVVPGLIKELAFLDASIYHLDGPGALRHVDRILELPQLNGIQWVYGAGQPGARHWLALLKKIQKAGKLIHINCRLADVETVCSELEPEGVLLVVEGCQSPSEAEDLLRLAQKASANRGC